MLRVTTFLFGLFLTTALMGQSVVVDSLSEQAWKASLVEINELSKSNTQDALAQLKQLEQEIGHAGGTEWTAKLAISRAWLYLQTKESDSIIPLLQPFLTSKSGLSAKSRANAYQHLGHAYKLKWIPDSAMVNYIQSLKLSQSIGDRRGISVTYLAMGLTYEQWDKGDLATYFFDRSMEFAQSSDIIDKHKEHITDQQNRPVSYDNTLQLSLDIAKIAEEAGNDRLLKVSYSDIKKHYFRLQQWDLAETYATKEEALKKRTASYAFDVEGMVFLGEVYKAQGRNQKALTQFQQALNQGVSDSLRLAVYQSLQNMHKQLGQTDKALSYAEAAAMLKDSMYTRETAASVAAIMEQFKTELQAEQIKSLTFQNDLSEVRIRNQRTTLFGTIGLGMLLLILGFMSYRTYRVRQQLRQSALNFKLLQTQMNPHFLFNALNEIHSGLQQGHIEESAKSLTSYSSLLRRILESSSKEFVTVEEDQQLISSYLQMQQLLLNGSFNFEVEVDELLDATYLLIPPMLVQPYVENAILHGVKGIKGASIVVRYFQEQDTLIVLIADTGKGIAKTAANSTEGLHTSMGTDITQQRIATYTKLYQYPINVQVSSQSGAGTQVRLSLPLKVKVNS